MVFVDYNKVLDPIELWAISEALENATEESRYKDLLEHIYKNAALEAKKTEDLKTNKIKIKRGIRQGDTIFRKLFIFVLKDVLKTMRCV